MVIVYARARVFDQIRSVAFIILYLVAFQLIVLGTRVTDAAGIALGIAMVVLGLTLFLEGLLHGLMPLGERVGVMLPIHHAALVVLGFGFLVGFGATYAEPAITALRGVGAGVTAWEEPLLFLLLENHSSSLVLAIGIGVGLAVALGMVRFYSGLSIKPFVAVLVPVLLAVSGVMSLDTNLASLVGLAWDSGAVTTGAVTVPLVLALSIGVSRSAGRSDAATGGFGVIMLASALPVLSVCILGFSLNSAAPQPTTEREFFHPSARDRAMRLFATEEALARHAFTRGTEVGRSAFFEDHDDYLAALPRMATDPVFRRTLIGEIPLSVWISRHASVAERSILMRARAIEAIPEAGVAPRRAPPSEHEWRGAAPAVERVTDAARAVIPLTLLLGGTLVFLLRGRPDHVDEVVYGVVLTLVGFALLGAGIEFGLARLGDEVGRELPRAFQSEVRYVDRIVIDGFDPELVFESIAPDGTRSRHFHLRVGGRLQTVEYDEGHFDVETGRYEYLVPRLPLFGPALSAVGIMLVLVFAFGMGFGSTLAEPALDALGRTVEQLTVGTVKRGAVVRVVAIGVGLGLTVGVTRLLYNIPVIWLLAAPYALLVPLTLFSEEEFAGIAWDSGGVTTGPVTVPLVLAMGLGIGEEMSIVDGFGVLAMASVFPILAVLVYGLIVRVRQGRSIRGRAEGVDHG